MSSKRGIRRRSCERKKQYPTHDVAERDARALARRTHERFAVYRCQWCHQFHVGHMQAWMIQAIRDREYAK